MAVLALGGVACLVASIAWVGCASSAGSAGNYPSSTPATSWVNSGRQSAPRNTRFRENVLFLQEANIPASEVYASFGPPDWESKELRLIAYRARNNQALFVAYGTNHLVTHHAVKKINAVDSLAEAAKVWLRSN